MRFARVSRTLATAGALLLLCAGCAHPPDEAQVRAAISAAADAARNADAGAFDDVLSPEFDGNEGRLDARTLTGLLRLQRLRGQHVSVLMGPVAIEPRGDRLLATFTVTLGGGGRLLPDHLGVYRVQSAWRKEDGDWRCYNATWTRTL
jgi:hypothetical protein